MSQERWWVYEWSSAEDAQDINAFDSRDEAEKHVDRRVNESADDYQFRVFYGREHPVVVARKVSTHQIGL